MALKLINLRLISFNNKVGLSYNVCHRNSSHFVYTADDKAPVDGIIFIVPL